MKRIITVQDISCVGKCSLTVALPVISAMGVEACVLPTAVLSTHTAFKGFTFRDLTGDLPAITKHWQEEKINFDAIYTGYLGSLEQINLMHQLIKDFGGGSTRVIVDPCMADNGSLYSGFTPEFAQAMAGLCAKADVIVPNLTEASFLLGQPYIANGYTKDYIEELIKKLAGLGARRVVLKGVSFDEKKSASHVTIPILKKSTGISTKKCRRTSTVPAIYSPVFLQELWCAASPSIKPAA